ncbi:MAG: ABC-F family ATP-binding cassette domain-containing protein [Candidatus Cloacimonetes bacterium]|nr:ABC-F family ATP-binding cassette domain-containing protein [Candidatus Cloacimonadota bacterium]
MADCVISLEKISKRYSEKTLFEPISFGIEAGDKIGLLGINGSGKSTLLKIINGSEYCDTGNVVIQKGLKVNFLSQSPNLNGDLTILEQIYQCEHPHFILLREYQKINSELRLQNSEILLKKQTALFQQIESQNAYDIEIKAKTILTILGFTDLQIPISNLSGGQQRRVDLARVLLDKPDIILLDEPTNHLDTDIIEWLQDYMIEYTGTIIFITHDRYFLDAVSNKILEIDRQKLQFYPGNYFEYLKRKELEIVDIQRKETRRQAQLQKEMKWLNRGAKARTSKPKDHLDRVKELIGKSYLTTQQEMDISFQTQRLGKTILEMHNLKIGYNQDESTPSTILLDDFSYNFQKFDRIGIIGPNGCGKTTLIKAIIEEIKPLSGKIKTGHNTKITCLSQAEPNIDPNITILDYIRSFAENIRTKDGVLHTSEQILEKFLFDRKMQMSKISSLSGGEKKRLYLLSALIFGSNFLILDEPTNDLDIRTLEILEDFLDAYQGCIIVISHDRFILDRVTDFLFIFQEDKSIRKFPGNYSDYLLMKRFEEENATKEAPTPKTLYKEKKIKKMSYKEEQTLLQAESEIEKLENEKKNINHLMTEKAVNLTPKEFQELSDKLAGIEEKVLEWLKIWEELSLKRESQ